MQFSTHFNDMSVLPGLQILSYRLAEQFHHVAGLLGWLELINLACGTRWVWGLNLGFGGLVLPKPTPVHASEGKLLRSS